MGRQAVADGGIFRFYFLILWCLRPAGMGGQMRMNEKQQKSMTTAEGWIEQWGLDGRMSKFRVQEAAQALRADAGAVREWADVARHTADGRVATNILRVLAYLPERVSGCRARLCVRVRFRSLRRMPGHSCRRLRGARAVRTKFPLRPASSFCCGRKGGGRLRMCAGGAGSQLFSGVIRGDIPGGRRAGSPARGRWPRGC